MNWIVFFTTITILSTLRSTFGFKVQCKPYEEIQTACSANHIGVPLEDHRVEFHLNYTNAENITYVRLKTCKRGFTAFPVEIFESFGNVEKIFISGSNFEKLSTDDWENAKQLKLLELVFNNLSEFITFNGLNNLEQLILPYNQITIIRKDFFINLDKLDHLNLQFNQIHEIELGAFDSLKNLRQLLLSFNQITNIKRGTFVGLEKLDMLDLSSNSIHTIEEGAIDVSDLKALLLSNNKLTMVSDSVFSKLPNLEQFDVKYNELTRMNPYMFSLQNLTHINLSGNHIANIDLAEFAKFRRLKSLYLSSSGFSFDELKVERDQHSTDDNMSLEELDITYNGLTNLNVLKQVSVFKGLQSLNMMGNMFTNYDILNAGEIKASFPRLNRISFHGVEISCGKFDLFFKEMKDLGVSVYYSTSCWHRAQRMSMQRFYESIKLRTST